MSLKSKLGALKVGVAGTVPAPEIGDGEIVHIRLLSLDDRERYVAIAENKDLSVPDRYRQLLPLCLSESDGTAVFSGPDDPLLGSFPGPLADLVIKEAGRLNFRGKDDPKAVPSTTGKSS